MRFLSLTVGLCLALSSSVAPAQPAAEPIVLSPELINAYHSVRLAQAELRHYRFVELPQQRRWLDDQIALAETQARILHRRVQSYRPLLRFRTSDSPVLTAAESYHLELLATQQHLRRLKDQRTELWRTGREQCELYTLRVNAEATRFIALRSAVIGEGGEIGGAVVGDATAR